MFASTPSARQTHLHVALRAQREALSGHRLNRLLANDGLFRFPLGCSGTQAWRHAPLPGDLRQHDGQPGSRPPCSNRRSTWRQTTTSSRNFKPYSVSPHTNRRRSTARSRIGSTKFSRLRARHPDSFFLDPFGTGAPFDDVVRVLKRAGPAGGLGPPTEVLLNFSTHALRRHSGHLRSEKDYPAKETIIKKLNAWLGGDWWHDIRAATRLERVLIFAPGTRLFWLRLRRPV